MIQVFKRTHGSAYIIGLLLGALIAFVVAPSVKTWDDIYWRHYDTWNPVAVIEARQLAAPVGELRAEMTTVRYRGECRVVDVAAIEEFPGGNAVRVFSARVDGQSMVNIPVGVKYRSEWRFWPIGVGKLRVAVEYQCDGRTVIVPVGGLS